MVKNTDLNERIAVMGILALIAEFENDIRRERQMDGIKSA
jgi:DNA invertase Pin-like site-specific DNA recombinase